MKTEAFLKDLAAAEAKIRTIRADVRWSDPETGEPSFTTYRWAWDRGKELQYCLSVYEEGMVPVTHYVETGKKNRPVKEQVREEFQPAGRYESTLAFNGTEYRQCDCVQQAQLGERCGGRISRDQPIQMNSYGQPRGLLGWVSAKLPRPFLSAALATAEEVRVDPNLKRLYGRPCWRVRAWGVRREGLDWDGKPVVEKTDLDLMLDAERDLRPLRIRFCRSGGPVFGNPCQEIGRIQLRQVSGVWVPVRGDFNSGRYWGLFSIRNRRFRQRIELNPETLQVNEPIDADTFEVEFPPDCVVQTEPPDPHRAPACGCTSSCKPKVKKGPWPGNHDGAES